MFFPQCYKCLFLFHVRDFIWFLFSPQIKKTQPVSSNPDVANSQQEEDDLAKGKALSVMTRDLNSPL